MLYTLAMRDDVDGGVCVVPFDDALTVDDGVLACPAASAVAVADRLSAPGTWQPHPTLRVAGRPVATASDATTALAIRAINDGTAVGDALRADAPHVVTRAQTMAAA